MIKEKVGIVTEEEKNRIKSLYERRLGLEELLISLANKSNPQATNPELYENIVSDLGDTKFKLQTWWDEMYEKYGWRSIEGGNWHINFHTNEIFLESINGL